LDTYLKYGFYYENLVSITKKGKTGAEEIKAMMANWRSNPPTVINGSKVSRVLDYEQSIEKDLIGGTTKELDFLKSDVLQFYTEDGSKISARPSGTEPKIKFYFSISTKLNAKADYDATEQMLKDRITAIVKDLGV
jgi:phosphoglucomutase